MKIWMKLMEILASKLTAYFAFVILLILVLSFRGDSIPKQYTLLVIGVSLAAMVIVVYHLYLQFREKPPTELPPEPEPKPGPDPKPDPEPVDRGKAREDYLRAVIADCRNLRLVGMDPAASDPARGGLTLEKLYISLDTTTPVEEKAERGKGKQEEQERLFRYGEPRKLAVLEALAVEKDRRMVLLGQPGTGKSTFVRHLALQMAQAELDQSRRLEGWEGGSVLPVIVSLGRLAETIPVSSGKGSATLIEGYLVEVLKNDERSAGFSGLILEELQQRGGLVLLDGLDEVADLKLRPIVVQAVEDFTRKYSRQGDSRFLVTCRTYSYSQDTSWQLAGWTTHELALLDEDKINNFVEAWYREHALIEPARRAEFERKRERLLAAVQPDDRRRLHEIAPIAIILTMMAVVNTHYNELPDSRAEVYERCVDLLLVRWKLERPVAGRTTKTEERTILDMLGVGPGLLNRALWEVAFEAHAGRKTGQEGERGPALVTESLLTGLLQKHFSDYGKVATFLDYCRSSNGLLMLQGTISLPDAPSDAPPERVYAFPHLTFEEYLAACHLVGPGLGTKARTLALEQDRWREVILFLGEVLCFAHPDQERIQGLLNGLAQGDAPEKREDPAWRCLWYAGDLLVRYERAGFLEEAQRGEHIRRGLLALVNAGALSPRERAAAADTLDELGYTPPDLYEFAPISGESFLLGKYPVTNGQYERFLRGENFAETNKAYWVDFPKFDENSQPMGGETWGTEGWDWLQKQLEGEEERILYPRYWMDSQFGKYRRNAPVVAITWYEANAYCRWLLANWEKLEEGRQGLPRPRELRLPTEAEWVAGAGGVEPKERFAWGLLKEQEKLSDFANTDESGIGRTTPVWMYPHGASPEGPRDMSGNVWEWQGNFSDKDHDYSSLRGGSWDYSRVIARVSGRVSGYNLLPDDWLNVSGFRVAGLPSG